jgi:hypothetical protein
MSNKYLTAPLKTDKMPPGIPFIVGNEAAERFSYYGMNGILVIFMTQYMMNAQGQPDHLSEAKAQEWYHTFVSVVYFLPLLGAFLADSVLGKYRVIFWLSIVYCFGHFALALDDTRIGLLVGPYCIGRGWDQTLRERERRRPVRRDKSTFAAKSFQLVLLLDQSRFGGCDNTDSGIAGPRRAKGGVRRAGHCNADCDNCLLDGAEEIRSHSAGRLGELFPRNAPA